MSRQNPTRESARAEWRLGKRVPKITIEFGAGLGVAPDDRQARCPADRSHRLAQGRAAVRPRAQQ